MKLPRYIDDKDEWYSFRYMAEQLNIQGAYRRKISELSWEIQRLINNGAERAFNAGVEVGRAQR